MAKRKPARGAKGKPKPPTPKLETALLWAALARLAAKRAEETEVGLELGDYKLHGTVRAEVILGPRRKPRVIELVLSADLDVDPPQPYSACPREKPLLAGLLASVSQRAAREIVAALPTIKFDELTDDERNHAQRLLNSVKKKWPGKKKRVGVNAQVDEVQA